MIFQIILVGLVLSIDSFSAAFAMGHRPFSKSDAYKFALSSGIAEGLCTLIGALAGSYIISRFSSIDHWVAFFLLFGIAAHMAYEGYEDWKSVEEEKEYEELKFHSFKKVLLVSFATSIDAFGVGVGLGISNKPIPYYVASISFWAFTSTLVGLFLARKLSERFGPIMHFVGAAVLMVLAFEALKI